MRKMEAEGREVHLIQCAQQGQVTRWEEHVVERKIGWSDIWEQNTSRLSFLLRSTYDVLPSPVNLVKWKVQEVDKSRNHEAYPLKLPPGSEQVHLETRGAQGAHPDGEGAGGRSKARS